MLACISLAILILLLVASCACHHVQYFLFTVNTNCKHKLVCTHRQQTQEQLLPSLVDLNLPLSFTVRRRNASSDFQRILNALNDFRSIPFLLALTLTMRESLETSDYCSEHFTTVPFPYIINKRPSVSIKLCVSSLVKG